MNEKTRQPPEILSDEERKQILTDAERLWAALQANDLGGYSDRNRPFYILHAFKEVIEKYGKQLRRAAGKQAIRDELRATPSEAYGPGEKT